MPEGRSTAVRHFSVGLCAGRGSVVKFQFPIGFCFGATDTGEWTDVVRWILGGDGAEDKILHQDEANSTERKQLLLHQRIVRLNSRTVYKFYVVFYGNCIQKLAALTARPRACDLALLVMSKNQPQKRTRHMCCLCSRRKLVFYCQPQKRTSQTRCLCCRRRLVFYYQPQKRTC